MIRKTVCILMVFAVLYSLCSCSKNYAVKESNGDRIIINRDYTGKNFEERILEYDMQSEEMYKADDIVKMPFELTAKQALRLFDDIMRDVVFSKLISFDKYTYKTEELSFYTSNGMARYEVLKEVEYTVDNQDFMGLVVIRFDAQTGAVYNIQMQLEDIDLCKTIDKDNQLDIVRFCADYIGMELGTLSFQHISDDELVAECYDKNQKIIISLSVIESLNLINLVCTTPVRTYTEEDIVCKTTANILDGDDSERNTPKISESDAAKKVKKEISKLSELGVIPVIDNLNNFRISSSEIHTVYPYVSKQTTDNIKYLEENGIDPKEMGYDDEILKQQMHYYFEIRNESDSVIFVQMNADTGKIYYLGCKSCFECNQEFFLDYAESFSKYLEIESTGDYGVYKSDKCVSFFCNTDYFGDINIGINSDGYFVVCLNSYSL